MRSEQFIECPAYKFPHELGKVVVELLRNHGVLVFEEVGKLQIYFPDHTVKEELIDLALQTRYKILLPNGLELEALLTHGSKAYQLLIPKSFLPEHFHSKHPHFVI